MAFVDPTAATLKADFPEFEDRDDDEITRAINVAKRMVDQSWTEGDYTRAIELYAAHLMTKGPEGTSAGGQTGGTIQSESLGPINVSYAQPQGQSADPFGLRETTYGSEFEMLQQLNRGGARVTW